MRISLLEYTYNNLKEMGVLMFDKRIKELRLKHGLSKVEMGKRIGVAESTIRSWENNVSEPRWKILREIAQIFGVEEDWLLGMGDPVQAEEDVSLKYYGTVAAGQFENIIGDESTAKVPNTVFRSVDPADCFLLKVNGDSMNKILSNGSYIVVQDYRLINAPAIKTTDILLIRNGDSFTIKRVRLTDTKVHFEPDSFINEFKVDTYDRDLSDDIEVIGRVIYNYRQF